MENATAPLSGVNGNNIIRTYKKLMYENKNTLYSHNSIVKINVEHAAKYNYV